jgi:PhnB protein
MQPASKGTAMKVAVFVKASKGSEAGEMPSEKLLTEMGAYNEELVKAGIMKDGAGLHPTSKAVRVRFSGTNRTVINGPFAETKELVAGYWVWEVKSMDEAIAWLKKCPNPMNEDSDVEIRPYFEADDFGAEFTPELRAKEAALEATLAMQKSTVQPYVFFGGRTEEALAFYKTALHAKVGMVMKFNQSPEPCPGLQKGFENKVMHCDFTVGNVTILASDGCDDKSTFTGFRLALSVPTEADAHRVFDALAAKGKVDMPLAKTFWSPCYGMVTDQFGLGWMVMVQGN